MGSGCSAPTPTSPSSRASPSASPSLASTSWATASAISWTRARGSGDDAVTTPDAPLLAVQDLTVSFATLRGRMRVLDGVGFDVARGEVLGLVGESGSGQSVTAVSMLVLLGEAGRIDAGRVGFGGCVLLAQGHLPADRSCPN